MGLAVPLLLACVSGLLSVPAMAQNYSYSPSSAFSVTGSGTANQTATSVGSSATPLPATGQVDNTFNSSNGTLNVSITAGNSVGSVSGGAYVYGFAGLGYQDATANATPGAYVNGPTLGVTNAATLSLSNPNPSDALNIPATTFPTVPPIVSAIVAESIAANGYPQTSGTSVQAMYNGGVGGNISVTHSGSITVGGTASNSGAGMPWYPYLTAIDASSFGGNGAGAKNNNNDWGGNGGNGGTISITTSPGSQIVMQGSGSNGAPINGITAFSEAGGSGCDCSGDHPNVYGTSGIGGAVSVDHSGSISSTAGNSIGIAAFSIGGDGGLQNGHGVGASPGYSGSGGAVGVTLESGASINLTRGSGIGILAASSVGLTLNSPYENNISGGPVTVTINQGASVASTGNGTFDIGVAAISTGSPDILQPFSSSTVTPNGSGYSGSVTVTNNGSITTAGQLAIGVAALSVGGSGVLTTASGGSSYLGNAGTLPTNAKGGTVAVSNGGTISTDGASAFGIYAASNGAGGLLNVASNATIGNNTWTSGTFVGGQASSNNGNGGSVTVTNSGSITTGDGNGGGKVAIGIVAQSIGGGGGSSGGTDVAAFVGDSGGSGGSGGSVTVTNAGTIKTLDDGAIGILAQSIGGGGGNGANAAGGFVAVGGSGGSGGNGNTVTVTLNDPGVSLSTAGDFAAGVIAQSVGGGGGNGGYAKSAGVFISASIGGTGGNGGNGGTVNFTNGTNVTTAGQESLGILAQSIGGGGGSGGAATAYSAGAAFSASIALGGTGGSGGSGGSITFNNNFHITTLGPDSIGLVAQSIGGGGGNGGAALAKSLAVGVPDIPTISFATALGGSGGGGGGGGTVTINNAGQIITTGNGAHGLLAQSVGGGGGNGGDSTAGADAIESASDTVELSVALGATGGSGGNGGSVTVANGSYSQCNGCFSYTSTGGNNAAGIAAQSIGGGGGASTTGQASSGAPNLGGETGNSLSLNIGLGAAGGAGGTGGTVNVNNATGNIITTSGSGSPGILAQSIGGGGGYAGGGSSGASENNVSINVGVGGNAGAGSTGGSVSVINAGSITTSGGDSVGILAQSIGGGGGVAGSTDASASINATYQAEDIINVPSSNSYNANVAIGGKGGSGADANQVTVSNSGSIATSGERAYGIEAQSIGGGGGNGGSATSTSSPSTNSTYAASVTVGGGGGAAGNAGTVNVTSSGAIGTAGYNAYGILAQSIGGGGGAGGDGSVSTNTTIGLGAGISGNGDVSGNGGNVTVTTNAGGTIATLGDDAAGIMAQSIGGGGGTATAGCTNSAAAGIASEKATACFGNTSISASTSGPANFVPRANFDLNVGGNASADGSALNVIVNVGDAIVTTGARSMGVVAQSIGGGGGYAAGAAQTLSGTTLTGSPGASNTTGAPVTVNLNAGGSITTSGAGAWGILAQSIGGGGGLSGDPSLAISFLQSNGLPRSGQGNAFANTVSVNVSGNIMTTGANAHGIFAQAIGGSGGIVAGCCNSTTATLLAGNTAQFRSESNATYWGAGGAINITQTAGSTIQTLGAGSVGIIAQSSGDATSQNPITVVIGGLVEGGSGTSAAGIWVSGGMSTGGSSASGIQNNTITIQSTGVVGTVSGISGTAILATDSITNVVNNGGITGSINLGTGSVSGGAPGTITNNGTLNVGTMLVTSQLTNSGTLSIGMPGQRPIQTTSLSGSFIQTSTGQLDVTIDSINHANSQLQVAAGATVAGLVVPTAITLLPGASTVLTAAALGLSAKAQSSLLYNWRLSGGGTATTATMSIIPTANFTPPGVALTSSEASLAGYLTQAWNNSDPQFASAFGRLSQITGTNGTYTATLDAYSARATQAQATAMVNSAGTSLGAAMSCPVFVSAGTLLGEDSCAWAKISGQWTNQSASGGDAGYQVDGTTYRIGGQAAFAPNWYVGGSLSTGNLWSQQDGSSGNGQTYDGSIAVKHTMGPWMFAGSIALAGATFQNDRLVSLAAVGTAPGTTASLQSKSSIFIAGGRLRGAYDFAFDNWYIRPYGDLDVIYSNTPGFQEAGSSGLGLDVQSYSKTNVAVSPMVEFGGRFALPTAIIVRPYVAVGVSFQPDNTRTVDASFIGAMPGDGTFQTFIKSPQVLGDVDVGVQLYRSSGLEVKAEYALKAGDAYVSQTGSLRAAYHF